MYEILVDLRLNFYFLELSWLLSYDAWELALFKGEEFAQNLY
jgi:hypothetical protein